jgi:hypothetical protein
MRKVLVRQFHRSGDLFELAPIVQHTILVEADDKRFLLFQNLLEDSAIVRTPITDVD